MSQIMRLRRRRRHDFDIDDRNNGHRHEHAFVTLVQDTACCTRPSCCRAPTAATFGKSAPPCPSCVDSLPAITKALLRRKVTPAKALLHKHQGRQGGRSDLRHGRGPRRAHELNLYITGHDEDEATEAPSDRRRRQPPERASRPDPEESPTR